MTTKSKVGLTAASSVLLWLATPAMALAEEENKGMALLIPHLSELIPACIAFVIIFTLLSKLAWPAVIKMMDERESKLQGDLDAAEQARVDAVAAKDATKVKLDDAQRQADEIIAEAKRDAERLRADMLAEAQKDAQATIAKARDVIEAEREKAMAELSGSVVDLSVEIASKVIGDGLDVEQQRALAIKYLAEVGSLNDD